MKRQGWRLARKKLKNTKAKNTPTNHQKTMKIEDKFN